MGFTEIKRLGNVLSVINILFQTCEAGHICVKWSTQPVLTYGMRAGNLLMSSNVVLSGNNMEKINRLLQLINMGALNQPTFSGVQANLVQPTINEEYQALTKETIKRLAGKEITVAGMIYLPFCRVG